MGIVISFPAEQRQVRDTGRETSSDSGTVVILPVVRVERCSDEAMDSLGPDVPQAPSRKRRRRS